MWSFGEDVYGILREQLLLRERLRPYVMKQMNVAQECGAPPMRPLFFDFPDDPLAWETEDQFMFGPDILVAPVLYHGARARKVYLPAGASWRNAWTDERHDGGAEIEAEAPLERIPIYVRNDCKLPFATA